MDRLFVLGAAILLAGLLSGGVYSVSGSGSGTAIVINKFTGAVWSCGYQCTRTDYK